ncbi:hypothetical protein LTR66_006368 [Elasticomyces elasticus]|nr:hypothetical protein LTR66_006368 [Elasticomyces elasticus]
MRVITTLYAALCIATTATIVAATQPTCSIDQTVVANELSAAADTIFGETADPIPDAVMTQKYNAMVSYIMSTYPEYCTQQALLFRLNGMFADMGTAAARRDADADAQGDSFGLAERKFCPWCHKILNTFMDDVIKAFTSLFAEKTAEAVAQAVLAADKAHVRVAAAARRAALADKPKCPPGKRCMVPRE